MDDDAAKQTPFGLDDTRPGRAWPRAARSGEGMASVLEHLREQLRERRHGREVDHDDRDADATRPPPG